MIEIFPSSPYAQLVSIEDEEQATAAPETVIQVAELDPDGNYGRFEVQPLEAGYGHTLGFTMERVLMRNIPGAAISGVKVEGLRPDHSTLPHAEESVLDFILNVRKVVVQAEGSIESKARLRIAGPGPVTAENIVLPESVSIINPDLKLLTLEGQDSSFAAEFDISTGTGYALGPNAMGKDGVINVDAVYTPVRNVNFIIEPTRVGRRTDFEKLTLEIWTDGSIEPTDAVQAAGQILTEMYFRFAQCGTDAEMDNGAQMTDVSAEHYHVPIEQLKLSNRTQNALLRAGFQVVGEVLGTSVEDMYQIRNFGAKSFYEIVTTLAERGFMPKGHHFEEHLED